MEAVQVIRFTRKKDCVRDCYFRSGNRRCIAGSDSKCSQKVGVAVKMMITVVSEEMPNNWCAYTPDLEDRIIANGKTRQDVIEEKR